MPRVYTNPPIVEALCELEFVPSQPWDWTVPGLVYARIQADFPVKRQQNVMQVEMKPEEGSVSQKLLGGIAKMQFVREDGSALVQVGPDLLVVNQLPPYPGWGPLKALIESQLGIYYDVAKPAAIKQIAVRYINRVRAPSDRVDIDEYFLTTPRVPEPVPQVFESFVQNVAIPYENDRGVLTITFGTAPPAVPDEHMFMLDLAFGARTEETFAAADALEWIEIAHDRLGTAFNASFTEKAHLEVFGEVRP